jgi:TonB family protein
MKWSFAFGLFLLFCLSRSTTAQQIYKTAEVTSAGDAYVPYQVVVDGLFILDVSLNDDGTVREIRALRDPGAMLGAAKISVDGWKFQPASREDKSIPSRMTVSFVYRPPSYGNAGAFPPRDFSPVLPPNQPERSKHGNYVPVGVLSFAYPEYPVNGVAWGSVVVQLTVDSSGDVRDVDFLHKMAGFDSLVADALKKWKFQAATFNGNPTTSKTVIAFVFQSPSSNSN